MNNKGQFSIIAALLVAVILVATVIITYSTIRNSPIQDQPQVLSAIDETNFAIKQILGFTIGYYCSVLQVTGNSSYARMLAINYLHSGLINIANMHPEWGASFELNETETKLHAYWFTNTSYSTGTLAITYNLTGIGIYRITYETSCMLTVQVKSIISSNQTQLVVTKDEDEPFINLGKQNFKFYRYIYANSTWELITPDMEPIAFANGTYIVDIPSEILDPNSYVIQVEDPRGLIVVASSFNRYTCTLTWNSGWWNTNYSYRRRITITNNIPSTLSPGYSVRLNVNTTSLVSAGKMLPSGNDLRIVYWNGPSWVEIDRDVIDMNTGSTEVWFKTQASISVGGSDSNYYMYYGNPGAGSPPAYWSDSMGADGPPSRVYLAGDDFEEHAVDDFPDGWTAEENTSGVEVVDDAGNKVLDDGTGGGWPYGCVIGGDSSWEDVVVKQKFKSVTGIIDHAGVVVRYTNKDNLVYGGIISPTSAEIWNMVNGEWIQIGGTWTIEDKSTDWHTQELRISGNIVKLYIDDEYIGSATLSSGAPTSGKAGFFAQYSQRGYRDNQIVRKYVDPEPSTSLGQEEGFPSWGSPLQDATVVVELLQNGTMRWLGQNLQLTTQAKPIPPIPVKAIHVNQTINNVNREVPFQIEDWASDYRIPLGLTSNASVFSSRTMLVFLVNPNVSKVTLWWNGSDTAIQTSYAITNKYFTFNTAPSHRTLSNGILTLKIDFSDGTFKVISTVNTSEATAVFMRINNKVASYGHSEPMYTVLNGTVRIVLQHEVEWSGGIQNPDCPNVYAHIVLTLPANATYYTYQLRLMFVESQRDRNITDLCPIEVTDLTGQPQTENGTAGGYPIISNSTGLFYNFSASNWAHHWSQFISGTKGSGIMFTDSANQMLYIFDTIAENKTGALRVLNSTERTIELLPVEMAQVNFTSALDVTWHGAVVTFDGTTPIYKEENGTGLWMIVEYPPTITVTTEN